MSGLLRFKKKKCAGPFKVHKSAFPAVMASLQEHASGQRFSFLSRRPEETKQQKPAVAEPQRLLHRYEMPRVHQSFSCAGCSTGLSVSLREAEKKADKRGCFRKQ